MMNTLLFYIFASVAVVAALMVVTRANPLMSALWLIMCLAASAVLFALLGAEFLAVLQILVYAGAVMVLFIFVIMLIDVGPAGLKRRVIRFPKVLGAVAAAYFVGAAILALWRPGGAAATAGNAITATSLGQLLLTRYAVPFEVASLLLLAATVGAVVMGKRKLE